MNDMASRKMACVLGMTAPRAEAPQAQEPTRAEPHMDFSEMFKTTGSR